MEKPRRPTQEELEAFGKKHKLREKHIRITPNLESIVKKYSMILKKSESEIFGLMAELGVRDFELQNGLRSKIAPLMIGRDESLDRQLNERLGREVQKKKAECAQKTNDLTKAFERMIINGKKEDWEQYNEYAGNTDSY